MKPIKTLFVIDNLSTGGAQRQMINLAVGLVRRGHQVDFFQYTPGDLLAAPLHENGIRILEYHKSGRFSLDVIGEIRKVIGNEGYQLILSFLTTPNFYVILAGKLRIHQVPVVVSERFCDLPGRVTRLEKFVRFFYRFADHLVVNSHHQRENFLNKYRSLQNRVSTIYNGYDLDQLTPSGKSQSNQPLKILTIASVSPYKNGLCLVEALRILRDEHQFQPTVDWIGQHVKVGEFGAYLDQVKEAIARYQLEDQWNWLGQRTDIIDQMHQHDVLVHPSYGEGLPNVVCEALACARPVIVSKTLDHPFLVQDGVSGFLFDYSDPAELAVTILKFSKLTADERFRMGMKGREYALSHLSMPRFIDEYEALFNKILAG